MATAYPTYGTQAGVTITLASLASDTSLLAGRTSAVVTTGSYWDYQISGQITTGTSPTASTQIQIWLYGQINDTGPVYPDSIGGTDATKTMTSTNVEYAGLIPLKTITVDSTSNRAYPFGPLSIAQAFGGVLPKRFGLFVVQNTSVALNATGGNHFVYLLPVVMNAV